MSRIKHGRIAQCVSQANRFDYLFPGLQNVPNALLPETTESVASLTSLAQAMSEEADSTERDSAIPGIYTYFGQFLDHEITYDRTSSAFGSLANPNLSPMSLETIRGRMVNDRSPQFDLDCVYGPMLDGTEVPRDGERLALGRVSISGNRIPGKDSFNDLVRRASSANPEEDREALIGDPRNDENLIIAQLHVAFLKAHNRLIDDGHTFDQARILLRQHFQWLVIHDFLFRIADPEIVNETLARGHNNFYRPSADDLFMPLEFSVAAYRFGHSMVRHSYNFNRNFQAASLTQLFALTALSGNLDPVAGTNFQTLPENWVIEWEEFLEGGENRARKIDTFLAEPLSTLRQPDGSPMSGQSRLATRNLLRGYQLRIPTGQAVAVALGLPVMSPEEIESSAGDSQARILRQSVFSTRTPLWYYILAENASTSMHKPDHLGPVGSTIVAEVLIELVRQSADSILWQPDWRPTLGTRPGHFGLSDLLMFAGVLKSDQIALSNS